MKCLLCGKRKAVKASIVGWMPCRVCQKRQREILKPKPAIEVTTDQIKEDRKIFQEDILQPFRDGQLSKEYVDTRPERVKEMIKEGHITEQEVKEAKDVWIENDYYKRQ